MVFYEIDVRTKNRIFPKETANKTEIVEGLQNALEFFNGKLQMGQRVFICNIYKEVVAFAGCLPISDSVRMVEITQTFLTENDVEFLSADIKEITLSRFAELLVVASRSDYIEDDDEELDSLGLEDMRRWEGPGRLNEKICSEISSEEEAIRRASELICLPGIREEVERILSSNPKPGFEYHPVHYVIMSDDKSQRQKALDLLVGCLALKRRLSGRRVCLLGRGFTEYLGDRFESMIKAVFRNQKNATVSICTCMSNAEGVVDSSFQRFQLLCSEVKKNHKEILSIFEIGSTDEKSLEQIRNQLPNIRLVVFRENAMTAVKAKDFLRCMAEADRMEKTDDLMDMLPSENGKFFPNELNDIYEKWMDRHVCEEIYPEYKDIALNDNAIENRKVAAGTAYSRLMEMVGLAAAKEVLKKAVDFHKARKYYSEFGVKSRNATMHMVFTGNPGSAKTTVARLFAQILKDNDILKEGSFIEAGRHNIVDMYLGGTAPRVHRLFNSAKGGVLFIDEAYSLVDGERGLYGDEAINSIVQEMENHRDDVIVIFAGYPDKMNKFLDNNPGLRSRIAFHVPFDDYNTDELYRILQLFAREQKMELSPEVEAKVRGFFDEARTHADFGNGRFVRNMFEQAQMRQSSRIVSMKSSKLNRRIVTTLTADDFEIPAQYSKPKRKPMGFRI